MFAPGIPSGSRLREPRGRAPRARRASGRPPRQGGRCLTGARSGDRGATFSEPRRRWPPAPGRAGAAPGRSSRNKVTGPAVAGRGAARGRGSAGAARAGRSDPLGLRLLFRRAGPGAPGRQLAPRGGGSAARTPPSRLRLPSSAPTKGQARGRREEEPQERAARAQSCGVAWPPRRGAAGRSPPRAFSRRGARRSLGLPKPIGESPGAVPPLPLDHFCRRKTLVFGKLGACAPVPGLHLDCFVFGGTTGQEDCTSQGLFLIGYQKKKFFFSFGPCLGLHTSFFFFYTSHHITHACTTSPRLLRPKYIQTNPWPAGHAAAGRRGGPAGHGNR